MIHFIPHYRQSPNAKWLAANSRVTRKCLRSGDTTGDATEAAGMAWHLFDHKRRHDRAKKTRAAFPLDRQKDPDRHEAKSER